MSHQSELIAEDIQAYLKQHENKELLRLLTCGSVDDGKSTLIGRLLHDTKMIYEDHMASLKSDSAKLGTTGEKLDLALLVDGLQAEREQGITIDVAYRYFSTDKRKFIIADTPGHEQYTRNMATGASTAQLAILMIDARHGVLTQTRRHSYIASLLGIRHIVVAVNKMDLVAFSEARFNEIREEYLAFAAKLGLKDIRFVPISALEGDNVVNRSENTPWFTGQPLMEILETVEVARDKNLEHFRFPVQYVNRPNLDFRGFCGTIASGVIRPGDEVMALPSRRTSKVREIVTFDGNLDEAYVDQAVTLTLEDEIDISRGDMLVKVGDEPEVDNRFQANVVWMTDAPLETGRLYNIKLGPTFTSGTVKTIHYQTDVNTLEQRANPGRLQLNEIGLCELTLNQPVAFDAYARNHATGSFIIIDRLTNVTIGAGMITGLADGTESLDPVSAEERQRRLAQKPMIIACNGKQASALALALERALFDQGKTPVVLTEESAGDSDERRRVAQLLTAHGLIAIVTNLGGDVANATASADSEQEIPAAVSQLVQTLVRGKRI
ncbi:sulfate adenylyltransferase subunit CysN [Marinobacter lutaoensis]|jgi:bifunctional enzyme CysN/CysC/sulfate adenylyltransferase subunit 1|uniref:Sulfate adenylyltransferase subunit 1 n=1 Tax=Marinobacter lutaoensis TaxID=135739 RepID=A0A1V2DWE9_9GAMM|nr:sulfate adenylyltransferase subunit CysN [Marinobacter lutaoensis]MBI43280.1 sulfate adenylyltransferase subunit CysN [Oceanospirillales bacterium]NVD34939.1 sulfate adenylyltransferase subunit CysN [Marinobacter lutaoensis]ONF44972.1 sulfate adenylyltransferase subunit CysN [Marinobacter lutaoensis]